MNNLYNLWKRIHRPKILILAAISSFLCVWISCEFINITENEPLNAHEEYDLSIAKYIESNPDDYSILRDILYATGLIPNFRTYGSYTFLAPDNNAFEEYFSDRGKSSYMDFEVGELNNLIRYHVFPDLLLTGSFKSGIIPVKTLSSDRMVSSPTSDGSSVQFNKGARITAKNIILPNGILHRVDKVIIKPEESIYGWVKENQAEFGIFLEAMEITGLDEFFNNTESDKFYTGFITPDSKFIENDIRSFADLAERISPFNDNYSDTSNALWSYIASHFTVNILSMSDAAEEHVHFGTVGKASAKYGIRPKKAEVVINYNTGEFPEGLDVDEFNSNNLVANGIIHRMDTMYNIPEEFLRTNFEWILADVPGLPYDSLIAFRNKHVEAGTWLDPEYRYWPRADGPKHVPFHKTNGWLTLNAPYSGYIKIEDHRRSQWNEPQAHIYGPPPPLYVSFEKCDDLLDITWKLPYLIPGKYKLLFVTKIGDERPSVRFEFDGKPVGGIINMQEGSLSFETLYLGIVEIKEGQDYHYFRHIMVTPGMGYHVAVKMEPVE